MNWTSVSQTLNDPNPDLTPTLECIMYFSIVSLIIFGMVLAFFIPFSTLIEVPTSIILSIVAAGGVVGVVVVTRHIRVCIREIAANDRKQAFTTWLTQSSPSQTFLSQIAQSPEEDTWVQDLSRQELDKRYPRWISEAVAQTPARLDWTAVAQALSPPLVSSFLNGASPEEMAYVQAMTPCSGVAARIQEHLNQNHPGWSYQAGVPVFQVSRR